MKSVWYDSENEVAFSSKELAIKSAKVRLEKQFACSNIEVKEISSSQYTVSGVRTKGIHYNEHVYIFEVPVCETVKDYIELVKDM